MTKAQMQAQIERLNRTVRELKAVNAEQLRRLVDADLAQCRILDLERMLDDAIDERAALDKRAESAEKELQRIASNRGMVQW